MNPIPADFDLRPLVGSALSQVRIDEHQVQLLFESGYISGSGKLSLECSGNLVELFHGAWKSSQGLEALAGKAVASWSRRGTHEFALTFPSGSVLVFSSEDGPYEDFFVELLAGNQSWVL